MAENSGKFSNEKFSIQCTPPTPDEDVASARILFQEGLFEEAKKLLHRVLIQLPGYASAQKLLSEINQVELDRLLQYPLRKSKENVALENPDRVIEKLERDLGLGPSGGAGNFDPGRENWIHPRGSNVQEAYDLGVAFFEMGCYRDALRESAQALKQIRVKNSDLGELGVAIAVLSAESHLALGEAFETKTFLLPILSELEISHESKIPLYYLMALAEERLGYRIEARAWLEKVIEADPLYRDAQFRIRLL